MKKTSEIYSVIEKNGKGIYYLIIENKKTKKQRKEMLGIPMLGKDCLDFLKSTIILQEEDGDQIISLQDKSNKNIWNLKD